MNKTSDINNPINIVRTFCNRTLFPVCTVRLAKSLGFDVRLVNLEHDLKFSNFKGAIKKDKGSEKISIFINEKNKDDHNRFCVAYEIVKYLMMYTSDNKFREEHKMIDSIYEYITMEHDREEIMILVLDLLIPFKQIKRCLLIDYYDHEMMNCFGVEENIFYMQKYRYDEYFENKRIKNRIKRLFKLITNKVEI